MDRLARNREVWTLVNAEHTDDDARTKWASDRVLWGLFGIPDDDLGVLGDVAGLDVVELGCGSAYFSAWLMRAGARPVAVDLTPAQLETARRCQLEYGLEFPLVEANVKDRWGYSPRGLTRCRCARAGGLWHGAGS